MSFLYISDSVKRLRALLDTAKVPTVLVYSSSPTRGHVLELVAYGDGLDKRVGILVSRHQFELLDSAGETITTTDDAQNASVLVCSALSS